MIETQKFAKLLTQRFDFFTGVPDSLLKSLCAYFTTNLSKDKHIIAANEGNAVALAAGHFLASGKRGAPAVVYMQNSGMGNALNPLISLNDPKVYSIPVLLLIGWRGEPNIKDEPQHIKQGEITRNLLECVGLEYDVLSDDFDAAVLQVENAYKYLLNKNAPYALVIRKNAFDDYKKPLIADISEIIREQAIEKIVENAKEAVFVSTTGMISRELFEIREKNKQSHKQDFLTVGSMGHSSSIALGIALEKKDRKIICLDGDGAALMHLGAMAIIADRQPKNFVHIVLNNAAHDSVGGQPTPAFGANLFKIARAAGYKTAVRISNIEELDKIGEYLNSESPIFIEILVKKGSRKDLGRPNQSPAECKINFMENLKL
ncbi:MAG: phosphonopyruvate decarboxylase [Elusimicrobiota bacterium]|jgi:phosphonopyruvate decarboxylase|nr:phosphonopyruvate decarboxylase [Elusimicrobiota bacterium]